MELRHTRLEHPFFSICIPQYNRTSFLIEGLGSLRAQAFRDFEVCISDDFSTDGREAELLDYLFGSGLSFVYQRQDHNTRYDSNLRSSVNLAQGRYCFLLGNDDALASPRTLENLHTDLEHYGPVGAVITNYEDFATGAKAQRVKTTALLGAGPQVASRSFRNFSFVSGVIFDTVQAKRYSLARWDGSEMYQMYLGSRIIAAGSPLLVIDRVTVRKDIQIPDEAVDSYARRPRAGSWPIKERHLPLSSVIRLVADAIEPYERPSRRQQTCERLALQLFLFTYPYWVVEYRRVQSWGYALGVCLGMRPRHVLKGIHLSWRRRARVGIVYLLSTMGGLLVPLRLFQAFHARLYRLAKALS